MSEYSLTSANRIESDKAEQLKVAQAGNGLSGFEDCDSEERRWRAR